MSLPEEISRLPCERLQTHMASSYRKLVRPQAVLDPNPRDPGKDHLVEDGEVSSSPSDAPGSVENPTPERPAQHQLWQDLEFCPMNPFMVPLELLSQAPASGQ